MERKEIIEIVNKLEAVEIKQLKRSKSYERFNTLYNKIKSGESPEALIRDIYDMIEDMKGFHYWSHSFCANKCVELIIKEN